MPHMVWDYNDHIQHPWQRRANDPRNLIECLCPVGEQEMLLTTPTKELADHLVRAHNATFPSIAELPANWKELS